MTMTDPIADMLTRVRNANVAMHDSVKMPGSKLKVSLASILEREGYIAGFTTSSDEARPGSVLEIKMKYTEDRTRAIAGLRRVSTPGLRVYAARRPPSPGPRRHGRRRSVDERRAAHRPGGAQAQDRRRGALLCLVSTR